MTLRADLEIIHDWITPRAKVLDLGCGDGTLLAHLQQRHNVSGYGLEIDEKNIATCIRAGVNVIHTDLDAGLADFEADTFDYVIMTQTLQAMHFPERLLDEMLRVGRQGIVTFPNFGHWPNRIQLALGGHMPVTRTLPSEWYDTPNIHLCTIADFERLCEQKGIEILERSVVNRKHNKTLLASKLPNLFGEIALYRIHHP
ncbi:methionine biosynthesis protein MetW [Solemya pervernicosa gill symbiont]|uniref:Methionine biosynthesis protein MetW n=1 Tax=Solemya pervernicosa gill symbiont TaxID=642797 RepID=A0A1T2LA39_9GAMM|nr:methionine biosynthesis protein MetW [Solemya pervernicosa gill symbiont]OOZ41940.1 methionine biosynthesis protein MetW [Solemya pervernicosa gill symbiont]